jgi:hypothetical protein
LPAKIQIIFINSRSLVKKLQFFWLIKTNGTERGLVFAAYLTCICGEWLTNNVTIQINFGHYFKNSGQNSKNNGQNLFSWASQLTAILLLLDGKPTTLAMQMRQNADLRASQTPFACIVTNKIQIICQNQRLSVIYL